MNLDQMEQQEDEENFGGEGRIGIICHLITHYQILMKLGK